MGEGDLSLMGEGGLLWLRKGGLFMGQGCLLLTG